MHATIPHHLHRNLAQRGISVVHQSPYSPDLNLCSEQSNRTSRMTTLAVQKLLLRPYSEAFGKYLKTRCYISLKSCVTTITNANNTQNKPIPHFLVLSECQITCEHDKCNVVEYLKLMIVHFHPLMLKILKMYNFTGAVIFDFDV